MPKLHTINNIRLRLKYKYRLAVPEAASDFEQKHTDEFYEHHHLMKKNSSNFWKCCKSTYKMRLHVDTPINGSSDNAIIAELFRVHLAL
jgi:hypothetical protein